MLTFTPNSKRTDVGVSLEYLNKVMKRRCTAFVISDFYTRKDFSQELRIANKKHDVVAIQIYDPRAKEMPDVGLMKVVDAETGHEMYIDTHDARLRKVHNKYWEEREIRLHEMLSQSHVDSVAIATDDDYVKMLMTCFQRETDEKIYCYIYIAYPGSCKPCTSTGNGKCGFYQNIDRWTFTLFHYCICT